jgi:hypothetical protein
MPRKSKQSKKYRKMRGGNIGSNIQNAYSTYHDTVPFLPPGNPYNPSEINGLGNGYYYNVASDLHAPNDAIVNTSLHGNIGPSLTASHADSQQQPQTGGRRHKKSNKKSNKKSHKKSNKKSHKKSHKKSKKHTYKGGKKYAKKTRKSSQKKRIIKKHRGGGLIPQDVLDLGRNVMGTVKSTYAGFVGQNVPDNNNPNPTYQPALERPSQLNILPPNIPEITQKADLMAANV